MTEADRQVVLAARGLTKRFPGVVALDAVDFELRAGEVHALLGENGAGKSTLVKCFTGEHRADAGVIEVLGRPIDFTSPSHAESMGVCAVHQEINLIPHLSIAENICLMREGQARGRDDAGKRRHQSAGFGATGASRDAEGNRCHQSAGLGATGASAQDERHEVSARSADPPRIARWLGALTPLNRRTMRERGEQALERVGLKLDVRRELRSCPIAVRQLVAIARAVDGAVASGSACALVLDEPTSSLDRSETQRLFGVMRGLCELGLGIVFITHFLAQVYEVSTRLTVLRDGRLVGTRRTSDLERRELVEMMVGKGRGEVGHGAAPPRQAPRPGGEPLIALSGVGRDRGVSDLSFQVSAGEIVGLAGLLGSGRTEAARLCFGIDVVHRGELLIRGARVRRHSPRRAVRAAIAMTPEDRRHDGIFAGLSVREHVALAIASSRGLWRGLRPVSRRALREVIAKYTGELAIKCRSSAQPIEQLSGGSQQKVILARWLATSPVLFILDEPTRGIDIGARSDIERVLGELRDGGMGIIFIGTELEEVVRLSGRVVILRDRRQVGVLEGATLETVTEEIARHED